MIADQQTQQIIATAYAPGRTHDFSRFKQSQTAIAQATECLADRGFQGLDKLHPNSQTPTKASKHHPLTADEKAANRQLSRRRMVAEHIIRRLKVFRILSERYRNRRRRFALRFNLIAAIHNMELLL